MTNPTIPAPELLQNPVNDTNAKIFDGSVQLERIREHARHLRLGPTSLLMATLAALSCNIAPNVMLDIGKGPGSLNLFVALVGVPGSDKSRTMKYAKKILRVSNPSVEYEVRGLGSGEGISAAYADTVRYEDKQRITQPGLKSVLWEQSEVSELQSLTNRQGSTLQSQLTKLYTAEFLNFTNKDGGHVVQDDSYRASFILAVQPGRADILLKDSDQGFPQRFVWAETTDPSRMRATDYPPVDPINVRIPNYPGGIIQGCQQAKDLLQRESDQVLIDGTDRGLDGHTLLTRAKVAALLAVLREHSEMTEDDWLRAGYIIMASNRARQTCIDFKEKRHQEIQQWKERRDEDEERRKIAAIRKRIFEILHQDRYKDGWVNGGTISQQMSGNHNRGELFEIALGRLVEEGHLLVQPNPNSKKFLQYRLAPTHERRESA